MLDSVLSVTYRVDGALGVVGGADLRLAQNVRPELQSSKGGMDMNSHWGVIFFSEYASFGGHLGIH